MSKPHKHADRLDPLLLQPNRRNYGVGVALIRFLDGKQSRKTVALDDDVLHGGGRCRCKKTDVTAKGGRVYYIKAVAKERWVDKKVREWTAAWKTIGLTNPGEKAS